MTLVERVKEIIGIVVSDNVRYMVERETVMYGCESITEKVAAIEIEIERDGSLWAAVYTEDLEVITRVNCKYIVQIMYDTRNEGYEVSRMPI